MTDLLKVKITKPSGQVIFLRLTQKQLDESADAYVKRGIVAEVVSENNSPATCPDCGRAMEQDGGHPYCEYCEG